MKQETILTIKDSFIKEKLSDKDKLDSGLKHLITTEIYPGHSDIYFCPRSNMEDDPIFRQIIPYMTLKFRDTYLLYSKTTKSGESRLHHKYSLGIGGHINTKDIVYQAGRDLIEVSGTINNGMFRELYEECPEVDWEEYNTLGHIYLDNPDVNKVHIGISNIFELNTNIMTSYEDHLGDCQFLKLDEIEEYYYQLEDWSQVVFNTLREKPEQLSFNFNN